MAAYTGFSTPYDPTVPGANYDLQRTQNMQAYQQALIALNAKKNNTLAQYGFLNTPDYTTAGGTNDFSSLQVDPNQQYGAYRNELGTEANALDQAQNASTGRGFQGGLANQAYGAAQKAVAARQTGFMQNLQSTLGGFNLEAGNDLAGYLQGDQTIGQNAKDYAGSQSLWQALNATAAPTTVSVPGASGGGITPFKPVSVVSPLNDTGKAKAAAAARSAGTAPTNKYNVFGNLGLGHVT